MNSSHLLNSTFKHICVFAEKSGFKIRNTDLGVAFYFYPDAKVSNYDWIWVNKKELLLGSSHAYSLFSVLITRKLNHPAQSAGKMGWFGFCCSLCIA